MTTIPLQTVLASGLLPYGIWIAGPDHRIIEVNPVMPDIVGMPAEALIGVDVLDPAQYPLSGFADCCLEAQKADWACRYAGSYSAPDGRERWLEGWVTPWRVDGLVRGMLCSVEDMTGRWQREKTTQAQGEHLSMAIHATSLGLWDVDIPSSRTIYNEQWCAMLGRVPDEVEPTMQFWQSLIHPEDAAKVQSAVAQHLAGETSVYQVEHRLRHKSGHWVWVIATGKIVSRDAQGQPLRIVGTQQNISQQVRLKTESTDLLRQMASLIGKATEPARLTVSRPPPVSCEALSPRQQEVLVRVARGQTSAEIARELNIAHTTVLAHRRGIANKIGATGTADLVRFALRNGLLVDGDD